MKKEDKQELGSSQKDERIERGKWQTVDKEEKKADYETERVLLLNRN